MYTNNNTQHRYAVKQVPPTIHEPVGLLVQHLNIQPACTSAAMTTDQWVTMFTQFALRCRYGKKFTPHYQSISSNFMYHPNCIPSLFIKKMVTESNIRTQRP